ncbi:MAG TPA: hypothetical protein ENG87_05655 [Candidatus Pacearchaeota archaeon]|nr:hypothetical protein [Candidatus Pacearchaeota archaeon]HDZ60575.1 hypothetical protein [Candidatus Pacearchaeota archaeon]
MEIQTYHKQNKIQREINNTLLLFRPDQNKIQSLNDNGIEVYNPKVNKLKFGTCIGLIGLCLITPMTNLFILPIIRWGIR